MHTNSAGSPMCCRDTLLVSPSQTSLCVTALVSHCRPVVLMRLRNKMAPSDVEHQLKFLVYTLERASELADQSGVLQIC